MGTSRPSERPTERTPSRRPAPVDTRHTLASPQQECLNGLDQDYHNEKPTRPRSKLQGRPAGLLLFLIPSRGGKTGPAASHGLGPSLASRSTISLARIHVPAKELGMGERKLAAEGAPICHFFVHPPTGIFRSTETPHAPPLVLLSDPAHRQPFSFWLPRKSWSFTMTFGIYSVTGQEPRSFAEGSAPRRAKCRAT